MAASLSGTLERATDTQAGPAIPPIARRVRRAGLTYLGPRPLAELFHAARAAERERRPGIFVEAGCARGGSAIVLAKAKRRRRPLHVHDVFGMIPPPGERDGSDVHERYREIASGEARGLAGKRYYGYEPDLRRQVECSFAEFGLPCEEHSVRLIEGLFEDTITGEEPVALAHVDGDWYESVRTCLERLAPRLVPGGVMVIDDYHMWSGCREAVDEYLARNPGELRPERRARLHLVRA